VPPGTAAAVEDADAEVDELFPPAELDELLHAAMPTASRAAAPATATRATRGRRLFRNINCAPWLRVLCAFDPTLWGPLPGTNLPGA